MFRKLNNPDTSRILLFIGAIVSILWSVYFALVTITIPYQIEFREGTALVLTKLLLGGRNPFIFENQPLGMNNYGLGYNLAVFPFAYVFGNTLIVHRTVTFIFILLLSLLIVWSLYKARQDLPFALVCVAFAMTGIMARGGLGAFPSAMGTFLFMAAILFPMVRSFDMPSLVMSAFLSLFAFYTKPYFVLSVGIVASYLLLSVSPKKALTYVFIFLILFSISSSIVRFAFPLYFINTIIGNISNTERSTGHLLSQFKQLFQYFFPVLIISGIILLMDMRKKEKSSAFESVRLSLDFTKLDRPLMNRPVNYYFFSFAFSLFAFTFILGPHIGSYLTYAYQILVPTFFCWFFQVADFSKSKRWFLALIMLLNLFIWQYTQLNPKMLEQKESREWSRVIDYVKASSKILNSPAITSAVVELGLNPLDSGQTVYYYSVDPYANSLIGPAYNDFDVVGNKYTFMIDRMIRKQQFDFIITTKEKSSFYHDDFAGTYVLVEEIAVDMPQTDQKWTLVIWRSITK